jgi:hypothetical protein
MAWIQIIGLAKEEALWANWPVTGQNILLDA